MRGHISTGLESRALAIVERCLDLEERDRAALIASTCGDEPDLAMRVTAILAMDREAPDLLSTRVMRERMPEADPVPERIGKYLVSGLIGRGGMGMVVRGERDDGLYRQSVAIKLIRADLRDERDRERFANERRLLARLSHPSIARILDGGEHEGRPYLVMELVEGRPVTLDLCSAWAGLEETLDAFAAIAEAVSHAHRNLVIHGDIKPTNIIRTPDGTVKLLDFGIGRMADLEIAPESHPLTPAYSAPERRAGGPPTVSSDVFSLGVLLFEMLADRLPGPAPEIRSDSSSRIAAKRISRDLRAVVAKANSDDPGERYPDVTALQADLQRYRQSRPVRALPPKPAHSARLFLRRNRLGIAIAAAFFLLLSSATIIALTLYFDAQRQRVAAEARFDEIRSLAKFQLFDLYDRLAETPGTTEARARLAAEAQLYLDRLSAVPRAPADVRLDVARGLDRLAAVLGVPRVPNLGRPDLARNNLARAAEILEGLGSDPDTGGAIALETARNRILRAQIAIWLDFRTDVARRLLDEVAIPASAAPASAYEVEALRRSAWLDLLGWDEAYAEERAAADATLHWLDGWPTPRPLTWHLTRADAYNARGDARYYLGDRAGALEDYRGAEQSLAEASTDQSGRATILARQMVSGYNIASALSETEPPASLVPLALDLVRRGETMIELETNDVALRRRHLVNREFAAQVLEGAGRREEALAQQRQVVSERSRLARAGQSEPRTARDLAFSQSVLGTLNWNIGNRAEACRAWTMARDGFQALARRNQLNRFDRERNLPFVLFNLEICSGARPDSAFRRPGAS